MCRSRNKPREFSKPGSQYDRAVVGRALATHPGSFSAASGPSTPSGCSPLRMGVDSQTCLCSVTCTWFDLLTRQLLLQERVKSAFGRI